MSREPRLGPRLLVAAGLALSLPMGCVEQIMLDGLIATVRDMEGSTETLHDFDVARQVSESAIGQLEGIYRLDNDDTDMQALLTRAWATNALRFMLDAEETASARGDEARAAYHRARVGAALLRARFFAIRWFRDRDDGFDQAVDDPNRLRTWLRDEVDDAEDAPQVLWAGVSWAGEALARRDATAKEIATGRVMIEHSRTLDPSAEHGLATVLVALDHASRGAADARALADAAVQLTEGKFLPARLGRAVTEACLAPRTDEPPADVAVIAEERDPLPAARLDNLIASQRARRYHAHWEPFAPCPLPSALGGAPVKAAASR